MVNSILTGFHSVTPSLTLKDSKKAIAFYKKVFGAELLDAFPGLAGKSTMHAVIQIGNSIIMMGDETPGMSAKSAETIGDSPAVFNQAVSAGARVLMPITDMFWGGPRWQSQGSIWVTMDDRHP